MDRLNKSTSANCADKRKKQRSRLRLWWGFLLLVAHTMAWAQDYPEYPANVSSLPIWEKQSSGDFKIEGVIDISSPIYVNGELKLYPVATSNNPTPTIRRIFDNTNLQYAVFVLDGTDKLSIVGNENNQLTFFGGTGNIINPIPTDERNMGGAVQCKGNAEVRLKYVNLARFAVKTEGGLGDAVIALNEASSNGKCYLDHTTFSNCYAGQWDLTKTDDTSWGRIFSLRAGTWKVIMDYVDIHDCIVHERRNSNHSGIYGMGGIIRSQGNVGGSLLMRNCTIKDNQYRDLYKDGATAVSYYSTRYSEVAQQPLSGQGGAINWRSGAFASNQETQVTISGCNFHDNFAMLGGAIATCATIEMNNTSIYGNKAEEGGGVYFWTYNADQDAYDGRGFTAEFNSNTLIYENTATVCGGGIAIRIDASDDVGFSADGTSRDVEFKVNLMAAEGHSQQISDNHAPKGAGVAIIDRAPKNHKNTREKLMDNNSNNPAYNRWSGEYTRTISIEGSEIFDNTTSSDHFSLGQNDKVAGGGIYIDKTSEDAPFPADYTVSNDGAGNSGGGGGSLTVNVKHGKIYGNNAINDTREGLGGGLYIANPMKNDFPSSELTVNIGNDTPQLHINKNQAYTHGGGFYILGGNVNITRGSNQTLQIGLNPNDNDNVYRGGNKALNGNGGGFCVLGGVVTVNGGNIEYNTAANGLGGGVYVSVPNNNSKTTIQGGANISNNQAKGGGGVYVDKGEIDIIGNRWNPEANSGAGAWELVGWETNPYNPASETTHTRITKNSATDGNGGGINAGNGEVDITNTLIYHNTASGTVSKGHGGGVYLDGGTIVITDSKILYDTAQTNGGGIDDHSGDIEIYGGDISHNTAINGRGGGIYTNAGDIRIWPSALYNPDQTPTLEQCKNTGTVFSYNTAGTNGGGLNTHIGRLDVRYAKVHHNVAGHNYTTIGTQGGSGGGMFCEGPHADLSGYTVRLLHTLLNYNKAYGDGGSDYNLTGRGGGLYLKYGSIFAEHCNILGNKADINGGGLDNHDGELRVYGSIIGKSLEETMPEDCKTDGDDENGNSAISGRGGGLYTDKGNLVVGPCDSYGFVESKASRICNNTAHINGGGINNHEGDITIHGDRINNNTAETGDGGGVYINSGKINMYGGQINNNKADNGKGGGVYGGGGTFKIMEREAHPILEILEIDSISTDGFTVHFHHVDRGYAMKPTASNKEYGIAFSKYPYPSNLGENEYWGDNWQGVDTVKVGPTNGIPFPAPPHTYNRNEGCSRFIVHDTTCHVDITRNTTYYVVAYGKYTYDEKNYFDASPVVKVKTHGDNPVVVTGVAFDITTNSASVNGKLFYEGVGTLLEKGIEISSNYGATWEKHPAQSVGNVFSVTFSGLESSKIYKARAYARCQSGQYQYESQDAEIITFFTLGNSPVVATGEASEITTNSATVSGELLYEGVGTLFEKGIEISSDNGANWEKHPAQSVGNVFSVTISGLASSKTYKARAYAKCKSGENQYESQDAEIIPFTIATGSKAPQSPRSVYPAVEENPFFQELTPLQQAMLASTPEEDTTTRRSRNGRPSDDEPVNIPQINYNTATYGGGICIDKQGANLIFSGKRGAVEPNEKIGQINNNYASEAGGGIYIGRESADQYAQMQMMGRCEVNKNHVPADKHGGGIYLDGRLYVGDKNTDNPVYDEEENPNPIIHGLRVDRNFTSSISHEEWLTFTESTWESSSFTPGKFNNVFLTRYDYDYYVNINNGAPGDNNVSVITLLSDISGTDANDNPYSHIGFSVLKGFCPVIATASEFGGAYNTVESIIDTEHPDNTVIDQYENWLYQLMILSGAGDDGMAETMRGAVFEDSESYVAVHTRQNIPPFLGKFIYLWGCWTHPVVMKDPETDNPMGKLYKYGTTDAENKFKGHYKIRNSFTEEGNPGYTATSQTPLVWEIYSPEGLSWFTSYVNGLNAFDQKDGGMTTDNEGNPIPDPNHFKWNANQNPKANAIIMNDLDMSAYLWVPIGSVQKFYKVATDGGSLFKDSDDVPDAGYTQYNHYYKGTFDGQGHIIKGLQGLYLTGIVKYGLFGYLAEGAEVKNTFVDEGLFISDNSNIEYSTGGIAGEMKAGTIKNSEARMDFNITYSGVNTKVGGLVGDVQGGDIHSSMAMPTFTGKSKYMGGLVGNLAANRSLRNSFANSLFLDASYPNYVGGLVGNNSGTVENCYSRYQGTTIPTGFGWFAGTNNYVETTVGSGDEQTTEITGVIKYCYAPNGETTYIGNNATTGLTGHGNYGPTVLESGKYGFKHRDQQMTENADNDFIVNDVFLGGLLPTLNNWVETTNASSPTIYTTWTRTMASTINDDYPVLQIADFNVVGSEDGIYMKYDTCVNRMWETDGKNFNSLTKENNPKAAMYLYNTNYDPISITNNTAVRLHIHENVGITQTDGAELHARVGVTFDNSNKSLALGGKAYDWHMFSSALQSAPMGLKYYDDIVNYPIQSGYESLSGTPTADNGIEENNYTSRVYMDPPPTSWYQSDDPSSGLNNYDASKIGYFPTNTPYGSSEYKGSAGAQANSNGSFDFYCFSEQHRHWINFKRQGRPASQGVEKFFDHWYQDANDLNGQLNEGRHYNIEYPNESTFQVGKGYMMGVSAVSMLMADGTLNNGDGITTPITNNEYSINPSPYAEELRGTNLVGNPYQSYLDFDKLANDLANNGIIHNKSYYLFDADACRYICYPATASDNQINAPQFIHPHQGFFVKTANGGNLTFKNSMRSATGGQGSTFRGDNFNYPLVNLFCYDAEGHYDVTTVEMNRPELGGGSKLKDKRNGNSLIYARLEDEDYQTLFAPTGTSTVPVRFEPSQNGVYTMRWGTLHGDFHYLHLVDNMSGADVDMLRSEEYRFEATTSDYISRFKLVFEVTDVEENPIEAEATTFAFCMGDELIVNGAGYLEVFDVQGRRLSAKRLVDAQSSVSLPNVAAGIYFLRLSDDKQVRTQKMVINY